MPDNKKAPRCPYCGSKMRHKQGLVCRTLHWYECTNEECESESPARNTAEEAYKAAMKRYEEPNRVLTLEEVKDAYFDMKKPICCELMWLNKKKIAWIADAAVPWGNVAHIMERQEPKWKDYGKTWRCWLCNPTDEERAATPWEGEKDDDD